MFFEYYILYWDDMSEENTVAKGIVYATGFTEAYQKLIKFFGGENEDNIIKLHIDGIEDPYNLGSICRSLYAAGCNGLILMERDWSKVEPLILKASAGAFEHLSIYWIQKEEDLIYYLKQHAIPLVMAHRKDAISLYDYTFPENFCLALGGALRGISAQLAKHSTQNIFLEYGRDCRYALDTASTVSAFGFEIVRQRRK